MHVKTLLFLLSLFTALSSIAHSEEFSPPRLLRVSLLEGDVTYQRPDLDKWVDLSINTPILEGDKIWVGREGRAEIEFEDGNFVRLSANTILEISRLGSPQDSQGVEIRMIQGLGTFELRSVSGSFSVFAPLFSARVKEAASFRLDVDNDGSARLVMFEGRSELSGQNTQLYLRKGESVRFLHEDADRYYLGTNYVNDDWDRWNEERNNHLARVKEEDRLHYGDRGWTTADLYNYGNWYSDSSYGRIWRPNVAIDWAPFRSGRWVWYSAIGWTWVSYEPWGWVPYHYGRWAYVNSYGWSWVPGSRYVPWCPGAVNWAQGSQWVGWVPLAPHEPWYPYGHSSVNIFVSKNFGHRTGVTYWHRDQFVNGTPVPGFHNPRDPYADGRIIAGQPRVTPTAASRMPVVGNSQVRTFNNADLEARRNIRERIQNAGTGNPPVGSNSASEFERMREQRRSVSSRGVSSFNTNPQAPGVRVFSGNSSPSIPEAETGSRSYDNLGTDRSTVRSDQRQRIYRMDGPTDDSSSASSYQRPSPSTWTRPTNPVNPVNAPSTSTPRTQGQSSNDSQDSRQHLYEVYRNRNEGADNGRYAPRPVQRESPSSRFGAYTPTPVTRPQGNTPSYTGPSAHPTGPPPSYQGPVSSRGSVSQSQSNSSNSGASNQEGRAASRGRMGR